MLEPPVSIERSSTCRAPPRRCARTPARVTRPARRRGPHAREEQRLVRVDVADAGHDRLIEQQRLDRGAAPARGREQRVARDAERVDAELVEARGALARRAAAAPCRTCARRGTTRSGRRPSNSKRRWVWRSGSKRRCSPRARARRDALAESSRTLLTPSAKSCPVMPRWSSSRPPSSSSASRYLPTRSSVASSRPASPRRRRGGRRQEEVGRPRGVHARDRGGRPAAARCAAA